jgi:pimeloyl-ACP methyl ester carboxylesterase
MRPNPNGQLAKPPTAPQAAGDAAYRLFCRPDLSPYRPADHRILVARARVYLARGEPFTVQSAIGTVHAYAYEPARPARRPRTHIALHGWTSEAAFMAAFIEPIRLRGDRVIALDLPAHGRSAGPWTSRAASLIDCARAAQAVCEHVIGTTGGIDSLIGHSMGAMIAAMLSEGGVPLGRPIPVPRVVLLAAPNSVHDVARRFGARIGLPPAGQARFERHVERIGQRPLPTFSTGRLLTVARPEVLAIHARDDAVVPFSDATDLVAEYPAARLVAVDGLGHAGVLFAPPVVRHVREFVAPEHPNARAL